jgi:outer membrane receptor protein involved in Fe transport
MRIIRLFATFAIVAASAACASERTVAPQPSTPSFVSSIASAAQQVPLLFVVDGVRYQRDQVPVLSSSQVASVQVMKGHAALRQYGPDASYGVVIITTKQPSAPRS